MQEIVISPDFKKKTKKAVASIVLFVVVYVVLILLSIGLAIACGYLAIGILYLKIAFVTLLLALGIFGVGLLTIYFLIKFIFTSNKQDLSRYTEISREQEPRLFAMIDEIVAEVGTDFPKKVFLSYDVNASVFYDSNFWSMFFPIRKNLNIGMGLINAVTTDELKGILAHEFGHFSQRSMKVGSYVYSVNYIIHNMLFDNDSYAAVVQKISGINGWISLPMVGGVKIIEGIQYVLQRVYKVVNVNYLALSREMEFHADEVAANVAGAHAISTSLMRLPLADKSLSAVLEFYGQKVESAITPENIYPLQWFTMINIAEENQVDFDNGFPQVSEKNNKRFNKSRINIEDQWASHPSTKERIIRVKGLNLVKKSENNAPATTLLTNSAATGEQITRKLFARVNYHKQPEVQNAEDFKTALMADKEKNEFPKKFNNYFDDHEVPALPVEEFTNTESQNESEGNLFSDEKTDLIYTKLSLESDIKVLTQIQNNPSEIASFDYDNRRYTSEQTKDLLPQLTEELEQQNKAIADNDRCLLAYFYHKTRLNNTADQFLSLYKENNEINTWYDSVHEDVVKMFNMLKFTQEKTSFSQIQHNLELIVPVEQSVKKAMNTILANDKYATFITQKQRENIKEFSEKDLVYFDGQQYYDSNLNRLYVAIGTFNEIANTIKFDTKKQFLDFLAYV